MSSNGRDGGRRQVFALHRGMVALAGGLTLALTAGLITPVEAAPKRFDGPQAQRTPKVPVAKVRSTAKPPRATPPSPPPVVHWPAAAQADVSLPAAAPPSLRGAQVPAASWRQAGTLPVRVAPDASAVRGAPVRGVRVRMHDRAAAAKLGLDGIVVQVERTDGGGAGAVGLAVDSNGFAGAVGGAWSSRLRLVTLPACALVTPQRTECRQGMPIAGSQVDASGVARGAVPLAAPAAASGASAVVALAAGVSGSAGDYSASTLSQSATWSAGLQNGSFTWSYPLRVPPGLGGPTPQLGISYDSGSVDGKAAATNNQPSWLGEGFELGSGFIERRYVSCQEDMSGGNNTTKTGDLCWKSDNATLSMAGHSSELIKVRGTPNTWRLKNEDGSRIERLFDSTETLDDDHEYWKLTTSDGTQYYFGKNKRYPADPLNTNARWTVPVAGNQAAEPCHAGTFTGSFCNQEWRWNLDYVVDVDGNSMTYLYERERNRYGKEAATKVGDYDRGGWLREIHYGQREKVEGDTPPAKVVFTALERCIPVTTGECDEGRLNSGTASNWPDVPFDQICASSATSCPNRGSPSFFTRKRLTKVTTSVLGANNAYSDVDSWNFGQNFSKPADASPDGLRLDSITHTGHVGSAVQMPPVTFGYEMFRNRVPGYIDGPTMYKPRLTLVTNETGGQTSVVYDHSADCDKAANPPGAPDANTKRCFPSYWTPEGALEPVSTWFNKYVVGQVSEKDGVGDAVDTVTSYAYGGGAAWRYDSNELTPTKYRTWGDWRGFQTVETRKGSDAGSTLIERKTFLRGMHGNRNSTGAPDSVSVRDSRGGSTVDHDRANGTVLEQNTWNGSTLLTTTISKPWISEPTATGETGEQSTFLGPGSTTTYLGLADGGERVTRTTTTNDDTYGVTTSVDDEGDTSTAADDRCTRTWYARNITAWLTATVNRQQTASVKCGPEPTAAQITSETRTLYDNQGFGAAPTKGRITETQARVDEAGTFAMRARATYYDNGQVKTSTDAMGNTTATNYQYLTVTGKPYTGGLVRVTTTDPKNFGATTEVNTAWGTPVTETDINNKITSLAYDGLGRLTSVWLPTRPRSANPAVPNMKFEYTISRTAPAVVKSQELLSASITPPLYITSYEIFDGLLRPRQTQSPEAGTEGGRIISDVEYDSRGLAIKRNGPYYAGGAPSGGLVRVTDVQKQVSNEITYDRAGRVVRERFMSAGVEKYVTSTRYGGNWVAVDPPDGQTPTTTWNDARGRTTKVWKHKGNTADPDLGYEETTYSYFPNDKLRQVRAPSGARWDYAYDFRGRLIRSDDPDKGVNTSAYDANDRVVTTTDARGEKIWTGYDVLGRVTETRKDGQTGPLLTQRVYDTVAKGKPTSSTRYAGSNAYTSAITSYDDAYRPTAAVTTIPASEGALAGTYPTSMTYNTAGNVTQMKLPAVPGFTAETVGNLYDTRLGLPASTSTTDGIGSIINGVTRSPFGESLIVGMGGERKAVWFGYSYEEGTRRLIGSTVQRETQGGRTDVRMSYAYDKGGNVTSIADAPSASGAEAETQCFRHDSQTRLTEAWTPTTGCADAPSVDRVGGPAGYWHSYGYDLAGNRQSEKIHSIYGDVDRAYTTPAPNATGKGRPHALSQLVTTPPFSAATTVAYNYDAAGNLTSRNTSGGAGSTSEAFNFDAEGHLASTTKDSVTTGSYVYDADGDRLIKKENGKATLYLDSTEVQVDTTTGGVVSTRYYQFDGRTVAMRQSGSSPRFQFADHQGTPIWSTDMATTNDVRRRRFTPFGADRTGFTPVSWQGSKGFVNGDQDSATGLTHLGAREYDPSIGRFISVDPVMDATEPQTLNGYAYARNNPVTLSDASGLWAKWDPVNGGYVCYGSCGSPAPWEDTYDQKQDQTIHDGGSPLSRNASSGGGRSGNAKEQQARRQVQQAEQQQAETKRRMVHAAKQLGKILMDELGITAGLDCFTRGDIGACAETALNVLMSSVGGFAGKIIGKYALRWKKAAALAKSVWKLGDEIIGGIKGFFKTSDDLKAARRQLAEVAESCPNSFDGAVRVRMADGSSKPIRQVKIGDRVLATDPVTGRTAGKVVTRLIVGSGVKKLVAVTVQTRDGKKSIVATDKHPFWTSNDKRWTDAADLERGDVLRDADGRALAVADTEAFVRIQKAYNLTVTEIHTYYVLAGNTPILVHNDGSGRLRPDYNAEGPHTTFSRDGTTGEIKKWATWIPQTNPRNPAPWEIVERFDRQGPAHINRDGTRVPTPHINLPNGGDARPAESWEIPGSGASHPGC